MKKDNDDYEFTRLESLIGKNNLIKLNKSKILIVGLGGVGGFVCESLARSFIGTIIIVDFDEIDITNINRQIIATNKTIGLKKTDVMEERIKSINKDCNVIKYDLFLDDTNLDNVISNDIDYIIDCCDSIKTKELLIKKSLEKNIKLISSMGTANKLNPNLLKITTLDKTYNDPLARILRKYVKDNHINAKIPVLSSSELPKKNGTILASNAFVPPVAGLLIANYVFMQIIK